MKVNTKHFGEVEVKDNTVITFEHGLIGIPEYTKYVIVYEAEEDGKIPTISWLQSTEEPSMALPIVSPQDLLKEYNPVVEDEILNTLGECKEEDYAVYTVLMATNNIEDLSINLKAPIVINVKTLKACQIIADNEEYSIRYNIYQMIKKEKEAGE